MWNSVQSVGCGFATADIYKGMMTYIVCQYLPRSDEGGLFMSNVLIKTGGKNIIYALTLLMTVRGTQ